jgi:hypothetical protein
MANKLFSCSHFFLSSSAALLRVFEHGVSTEDKRLATITFEEPNGCRTPILLKIFAVLAEQLAVCEAIRLFKERSTVSDNARLGGVNANGRDGPTVDESSQVSGPGRILGL